MKKHLILLTVATALAAVGCGAGDNATESENKAFKTGDKSAIKPPPPGANVAPPGFKSSLGGSGAGPGVGAPAGAPK